ncbi:hypothetical protein K435DRAFT_880074 [Dendrothele bispora CBS 962.96]|uniref:Alpha-L-arabinofuranosidase 1 catalytic domain-containing protein n=1 Tax=Dendrothele bispora (strain CBS 962.96) TaxID=1314807 RepID=A0A4S8KK39_DENBC|nr:hypothetical protein K435DRAFT_880074 [Dendrothele bispora CBS 962.96]
MVDAKVVWGSTSITWCEDIGAEPIMWDGYSVDGQSVAQGDLQPYIQRAIDQINFAVGDATQSAAVSEPTSTVQTLGFMATSYVNNPLNPKPQDWDVHVFSDPTWFVQNTSYYDIDSYTHDGKLYFEREHATISANSDVWASSDHL